MEVKTHPIEATLARLASLDEYLRPNLLAEPDGGPGWLSAPALALRLDEVLARVAGHYKVSSLRPAVSLWFGHYAFIVAAVAIAAYLTERRVPDLSPENVWVRLEEDPAATTDEVLTAFAWRGRVFAALADDPEAGHPDCVVLSSREALCDHLREEIIAHLTPMIQALRACSSFGSAGLWALASDTTASTFTWIGELLGDPSIGLEESRAFNAAPSPLHRKRDFIHVEHCGLMCDMVDRTSCCLYYKVEGGEYCTSCPHRPPEERVERVRARLEKQAVEAVQR